MPSSQVERKECDLFASPTSSSGANTPRGGGRRTRICGPLLLLPVLGILLLLLQNDGVKTSTDLYRYTYLVAAQVLYPNSVVIDDKAAQMEEAFHEIENGGLVVPTPTPVPTTTMTTTTKPSKNITNYIQFIEEGKRRPPVPKHFSNFFSHIPKSGSSYAFTIIHKKLFLEDPIAKERKEADPDMFKFRACNVGTAPVKHFDAKWTDLYKEVPCNLWMSEAPYSTEPERSFVITRDPRQHVLSMFFHCAESKDHRNRAHRMPENITVWLEDWVAAIGNETQAKLNKQYSCYDPRESQSKWVTFADDRPTIATKEKLRKKWTLIGDNAQMDLSICLIYTVWMGWVPGPCDCTSSHGTEAPAIASNNGTTTATPATKKEILYNGDNHAHGVTHHGASYQTTAYQDSLIAKLRVRDEILYKMVKSFIMTEQVREVESQYGVKLCRKLKF